MCMSEYLDREFVAVPRLPLLTECAPLAAAVAASRTTSAATAAGAPRAPTIPRYTDTAAAGSPGRRPTWRRVRLRLGKSGHPVEVEDQDRLSHEAMAGATSRVCNV